MSLVRSALHLRTGETTAAEAISSWLRQYRVGGTDFSDAFEACVYLLEQSEQAPDLAFVGTDWLTPDEFPIIRYIHETWPGAGVIVYGDGGELPPRGEWSSAVALSLGRRVATASGGFTVDSVSASEAAQRR